MNAKARIAIEGFELDRHVMCEWKSKRQHHVRSRIGNSKAGAAANQAEKYTLGQYLAHDSAAGRTERHAHGHIGAPRGAACKQQVGNIRAGNEKYNGGENHEQTQARAGLLLEFLNATARMSQNHMLPWNHCCAAAVCVHRSSRQPLP